MIRRLQNALIALALGALFSQGAFAQMPGSFSILGGVAGSSGVQDCLGGSITYANGQTIHTFASVGNYSLVCSSARTVSYLVVGGGGGSGGASYSGGGGAGGMLTGTTTIPIGSTSITVGTGGLGGASGQRGANGSDSLIATPGGAGSFVQLLTVPTGAVYGSGFGNYELRTRYNLAAYNSSAPATSAQFRVTIQGGAAGSNVLVAMYCGHPAAASPSLNFDGSQVQVMFGGNAGATVPPSGSPLVSDTVNYSFDKTKDFICSANWNATSIVYSSAVGANIVSSSNPGQNASSTTFPNTANAASSTLPITLIETFSTTTTVADAKGGGGGGSYASFIVGNPGGSGGGGAYSSASAAAGTAGQGNAGGQSASAGCGNGGGGSGAAGTNCTTPNGSVGGAGLQSSITGTLLWYAAGGGGGPYTGTGGLGGSGIGGNGGNYSPATACTNGASNTGSGAGGIASNASCAGGSGIVVVSYPSGVQNPNCIGGTITTVGARTVHTFTSSGAISCATGKSIDYLVVGGGGWGGTTSGSTSGAGGGAGGLRSGSGAYLQPGSSTITIGAGAPTPPATSTSCTVGTGGNSSIFGIASVSGGGNGACSSQASSNGGSGSGASTGAVGTGLAGQGNNGGLANAGTVAGAASGGGGGCSAVGGAAPVSPASIAGIGGAGCSSSITGTSICYAGGGAAGLTGTGTVATATCGGGNGGTQGAVASAGTPNRGGGGGGAGGAVSTAVTGTAGGSGIAVISYLTGSTQPPPPGNWLALIPTQSPPSLGSGFTNYEMRVRFLTSGYQGTAPTTGTRIRVTVTGGGATTNSITQMWCGQPIAASPSLNYDGSQVQITFSGSPSVVLPTGVVLSDSVPYPFDKTRDFICSVWNGGNSIVYSTTAGPNFFGAGNPGTGSNVGSSTTTITGTSGYMYAPITLVEVFG
jgi:hypothetical protein